MLFPSFTLKSVTFVYAISIFVVYIITVIAYRVNEKKYDYHWTCLLYQAGAKFSYSISRKGHIHRLILPMILHNGFLHFLLNFLSLFFIGFTVEIALKSKLKFILLLLLSALGGNLFSALVSPCNISIGASTSIYGINGVNCVWYYLNWYRLGP